VWREVEKVGVGDVLRGRSSKALVWGDIDPHHNRSPGCQRLFYFFFVAMKTCFQVPWQQKKEIEEMQETR
jgi:hypothetical protein